MKSNRLYLLLVVLSALVLAALSAEETSSNDDTPLESRRRASALERNEQRQRQRNRSNENEVVEPEDTDAFRGFFSSYNDNRYTAANGAASRTRSRWPQQQQQQQQQASSKFPIFATTTDSAEADDWSGIEFPNPIQVNVPTMPFGNLQAADNPPTCYSLVDSQYPIFSDVCGAVPQARYALPNSLGLHERWQLAQFLTNIVGSSTESGCTRSLRLLVCPLLFPPCQSRQEAPPVLPCQSYCRAVKSRCSIPTLDAISCEALPIVSDICPTNQAYGSFIPPGAQTSFSQPSPMNGGGPTSNYQASRALASLQSLLAAQAAQSHSLAAQEAQSQYNPALLAAQNRPLPPSPQQQQQQQQGNPLFLSTKTAQIPVNSHSPYSADTLSSALTDYTAQSAAYPQAQGQRYASPLARPSPADARYAGFAYPRVASAPSGPSSLVKA